MVNFEAAFQAMMSRAGYLGTETVELCHSIGRVLAQDVTSDINMPPFDKSAMDGFACKRADLDGPLTLVEHIPAGQLPTKAVGKKQCSKIMTGAPVPRGADCVIMVEFTQTDEQGRIVFTGENTKDNICLMGEDIQTNEVVIKARELLQPAHVATLATVGVGHPVVAKRPRVAAISTGSELVTVDEMPRNASIRDSNSHLLAAMVTAMGMPVTRLGFVEDSEQATVEMIQQALAHHDVVLISGGVSMGDFDFVPSALKKCGFSFEFESVAMQPGKPTVFGHQKGKWCFGLPGNPVSNYVVFERLVKPFLYALEGHAYRPKIVQAILEIEYKRKNVTRQAAVPVQFTSSAKVVPVAYHGSAHINSYTAAHGLIFVQRGVDFIDAGSQIDVRLL